MSEVVERARAWILGDPDPLTRAELSALLDSENRAELADRMDGTLAFGTAGLRGVVEAGSNRMNRATVIRTTRGLADYLLARHGGAPSGPVVVGRDARPSSSDFMNDAVGVLSAAGLAVRFWEEEVPTPLVAYAVRVLGACAGVMITASHNPPRDNGYKVYDANGAQIIPPVDAGISSAIDRVGAAAEVPLTDAPTREAGERVGLVSPGVWGRYRKELTRLRSAATVDPGLRIVYTPMHGVGWRYMSELLAEVGYPDVHAVAEQAEPDGYFPTLPFPNPEEPGAMDLALGLARRVGADLVLANDPDADRLGVAVPGAKGWVNLTGNQVGVLLTDHILSHRPDRGGAGDRQPLIISTIVSSPMARLVAAAHGARFETTLTGFKWIMNAALDIEDSGRVPWPLDSRKPWVMRSEAWRTTRTACRPPSSWPIWHPSAGDGARRCSTGWMRSIAGSGCGSRSSAASGGPDRLERVRSPALCDGWRQTPRIAWEEWRWWG